MSMEFPKPGVQKYPLRLVLIEHNEITCLGLRAALSGEPDLVFIGEAGPGDAVLSVIDDNRPDAVIIGSCPAGVDRVELARSITSSDRTSAIAVIVIAGRDDTDELVRAIQAGASAVLPINYSLEDLLGAVRAVGDSAAFLTPSALQQLFSIFRDCFQQGNVAQESAGGGVINNSLLQLTTREREVAEIVAQGSSNQQIARHLGLSEKTVEGHLSRMYVKLGIASRAALASAVTRALHR